MSEKTSRLTHLAHEVGNLIGTAEFVADHLLWRFLASELNPFSATTKYFAARNLAGKTGPSGIQVVLTDGYDIAAALSQGLHVSEVDAIGLNPKTKSSYVQSTGVCIIPKEIDSRGILQPWSDRQEPRSLIDGINQAAEANRRQGYSK